MIDGYTAGDVHGAIGVRSANGVAPAAAEKALMDPVLGLDAHSPREGDQQWIRTYHARHGRRSATVDRTISTLGGRYAPDISSLGGQRLVVEVGCGLGVAAVAFAVAHPDQHLVAADVHLPGISQLLQQVDDAGITNLSVLHGDAIGFLHDLAPGRLGALHLFFPDPWPKARHRKRRFVRPDLLDLVGDRLESGGELLMATDVADYAVSARNHLDGHPLFVGGPCAPPAWRPVTGYHERATRAGRAVTDLAYRRI